VSERTFSSEIYQLQIADYKESSDPKLVQRGKRKPIKSVGSLEKIIIDQPLLQPIIRKKK